MNIDVHVPSSSLAHTILAQAKVSRWQSCRFVTCLWSRAIWLHYSAVTRCNLMALCIWSEWFVVMEIHPLAYVTKVTPYFISWHWLFFPSPLQKIRIDTFTNEYSRSLSLTAHPRQLLRAGACATARSAVRVVVACFCQARWKKQLNEFQVVIVHSSALDADHREDRAS